MGGSDSGKLTDAEKKELRKQEEKEARCNEWKLFLCDPNGDGQDKPTCLCKISCANWCIILACFAVYYTFIGMFFWGMIEAMFVVFAKPSPADRDALKILSPVVN
eukprot:TRINITY_DN751_c1_g1_i1.p1 TRINITY_DN751_c1_g1~~TRINITY_DN751_c1_g1_i1.p1  ORF type:complete len:105 (+),score=22.73 TRINITY_DN751_c1_g1_i1:50-364(+)